MKNIEFTKMHGLGNDFVVVDEKQLEKVENIPSFVVKVCDRHFGIGADGVLVAKKGKDTDIEMRIFNSDGSEAEMCGNGIRGIAIFAKDKGWLKDRLSGITVSTKAGIKTVDIDQETKRVTVDMGKPVIGDIAEINGLSGRSISMGNPHFVIVSKSIDKLDLPKIGPSFESHKIFPNKTNTEFVQIQTKNTIKIRVWERGAGETLACGTGACASVVSCLQDDLLETDKANPFVNVELPGGWLKIRVGKDGHVYMNGPAESVFSGKYFLSKSR
jgi:diaminopimelate epimerase